MAATISPAFTGYLSGTTVKSTSLILLISASARPVDRHEAVDLAPDVDPSFLGGRQLHVVVHGGQRDAPARLVLVDLPLEAVSHVNMALPQIQQVLHVALFYDPPAPERDVLLLPRYDLGNVVGKDEAHRILHANLFQSNSPSLPNMRCPHSCRGPKDSLPRPRRNTRSAGRGDHVPQAPLALDRCHRPEVLPHVHEHRVAFYPFMDRDDDRAASGLVGPHHPADRLGLDKRLVAKMK